MKDSQLHQPNKSDVAIPDEDGGGGTHIANYVGPLLPTTALEYIDKQMESADYESSMRRETSTLMPYLVLLSLIPAVLYAYCLIFNFPRALSIISALSLPPSFITNLIAFRYYRRVADHGRLLFVLSVVAIILNIMCSAILNRANKYLAERFQLAD